MRILKKTNAFLTPKEKCLRTIDGFQSYLERLRVFISNAEYYKPEAHQLTDEMDKIRKIIHKLSLEDLIRVQKSLFEQQRRMLDHYNRVIEDYLTWRI